MKSTAIIGLCIATFMALPIISRAAPTDDFVTTWKTDNSGYTNNTSIWIPMVGGPYEIDWDDDGVFDQSIGSGSVTHNFGVSGTYRIRIRGSYDTIRFNNEGDKEKIISLDQWGTQSWASMNGAFWGASNLEIPATDTPDFSAVTSMAFMFTGATLADPDTSGWDTSEVNSMAYMFTGATLADPDTSGWDTSNVTDMTSMFSEAANANPDTSGWNTSKVTLMHAMFWYATSANPNTSGWDTSKVSDFSGMFIAAASANPDTSGWDTTSAIYMRQMFVDATSANPDVSGWNTWAIDDMYAMFSGATSFDRDIGSWNVTYLTNASDMFDGVELSTSNYESLLIGWNSQALHYGVIFDGGNSKYCSEIAAAARENMINSHGWVITDGGQACPPIDPTVAPDLTPATDTGVSDSDNITSDRTPDFYVVCSEIGNTISLWSGAPISEGAVFDGAHTCTSTGVEIVSVTEGQYLDGLRDIVYTESNGNGESGFSPSLAITIVSDTEAPTVAPDLTPATDTGESDSDNLTSNTTPDFYVECSASGNTITLYTDNPVANSVIGSHVCTAMGTETATVTTALVAGNHNITYTDSNAGGESGHSPSLAITVVVITGTPADDFVTTWQTDNPGTSNDTSITVPMIGGPYHIDWDNDGTFDQFAQSGPVTHDFGAAGTYQIRMRGSFNSIRFDNGGDKEKIISLDQWGTNAWTSMYHAFRGAINLTVPATDTPDFSSVTDMRQMFAYAQSANPDTSDWDTSSVTDMGQMFAYATAATPNTSNWNTSSVTSMLEMFVHASSANPDTSNWDTSSVTKMTGMFQGATSANPDTSNWDTSSVFSMHQMFASARSANPDTSGWDTSSVLYMERMFSSADSANPDTSGWDTSSVINMSGMFSGDTSANPNTSNWDTSAVTDMHEMFYGAKSADPDTSAWDTSAVTDMNRMFYNATSANPDTSAWDTSAVTDMHEMFRFASSANPDTSGWDTSQVTDMSGMFIGASSANPNTSNWDTAKVTDMSAMFSNASLANPDTSGWNTSQVTNMSWMFYQASSANPNTSGWDTSQVTDMSSMFYGAPLANPDTSGWDTSSVTNMSSMFVSASSASPDTSGWDTSAVTNMYWMFLKASLANPNTSGWDTSAVTDMHGMFASAISANPDTSGWDTSAVIDMHDMFVYANSANPNISNWDTSAVTNMSQMFFGATSFDRDMGSWSVSSLTDATNMLANVTLSTANYDSLLTGWNAQTLQPGVVFSGGNSTYCSAEAAAARANMIATNSWVITDGGQGCDSVNDFVTTWQTDNVGASNSTSIIVPMVGGPYEVDWNNDEVFDEFGLIDSVTHDFGVAGTYIIRIRGVYDSIRFANEGDKEKIVSLDQWGTNSWSSMQDAFSGCVNLEVPAVDIPDFSAVTNMSNMFWSAGMANPETSGWDTSSVADMSAMFQNATSANPDTSGWDTSSVTSMFLMFDSTNLANPNTSGWDTSAVTDMSGMFQFAKSANPDTSGWSTATVTSMTAMFNGATSANPNTSGWDTSSVTDMALMFSGAISANPDVSNWDTSSLETTAFMFTDAISFDRDIGSWDVTALKNKGGLIDSADGMFAGVTLSTTNYESLLIGWSAQSLQPGVVFSGGNSTYCSAEAAAARANMIASHGWTITDGGQSCPPAASCNTKLVSSTTEYFDTTHEACEILVLGPDFIAADGSKITANSGWEIEFLPGFIVEQGATLNANVCGQSLCITSPDPMSYGCHTCVDQICDVEPSCCELAFDQGCLDKVDSVCGLVCE